MPLNYLQLLGSWQHRQWDVQCRWRRRKMELFDCLGRWRWFQLCRSARRQRRSMLCPSRYQQLLSSFVYICDGLNQEKTSEEKRRETGSQKPCIYSCIKRKRWNLWETEWNKSNPNMEWGMGTCSHVRALSCSSFPSLFDYESSHLFIRLPKFGSFQALYRW